MGRALFISDSLTAPVVAALFVGVDAATAERDGRLAHLAVDELLGGKVAIGGVEAALDVMPPMEALNRFRLKGLAGCLGFPIGLLGLALDCC